MGYATLMIPTDVEHIRRPVGFPTDLAPAVPLVLLADILRLDAVSWGTIAESAYRVGHQRFDEYYQRPAYAPWAPIFDAVGMPIVNPMAGVSEVGTSTIVRKCGLLGVAQSCIRGRLGAPCQNCWKCFRKSLLDSAIAGTWPSSEELDRLFRIPEAIAQLSKVPIKHENVVAYLAGKYDGRHPGMLLLKRRVRALELDLSYLDRWYGPSSEPWYSRYRGGVCARLDELLGRMTSADEAAFESWTTGPLLRPGPMNRAASAYAGLAEALVSGEPLPSVFADAPAATFASISDELRRSSAERLKLEKRVERADRKAAAVRNSSSYKIGRFLGFRGEDSKSAS